MTRYAFLAAPPAVAGAPKAAVLPATLLTSGEAVLPPAVAAIAGGTRS
ncbi:hypothetical protein [Streptomyces sp. NPDC001985]